VAHLRKYPFHYAWVVLVAACICNIVARADAASFGVFIDPLVQTFGWTRGEISVAYSIAYIVGMPAIVLMGWLGDRYGTRPLMLGAAMMIGVGTVLLGTITTLWEFYVYYSVFVGSLGHAAFSVLLPVIITRWFHKNVGVASGIYWASQGLGPVIFAPLFRHLIETQGWSHTFMLVGVIVGCILAFFSLFIYGNPASLGLLPHGMDSNTKKEDRPSTKPQTAPLREILKDRRVWILWGIHHIGCLSHAVILAHVVSMATFTGLGGVQAAGVLATIAGTSIISRFVFSVLADKLGGRAMLSIALTGQALPVFILIFATEAWMFYGFAIVFGLFYGGEMVGFPIINKQLFGAKAPLGSIYSFQMVGGGTGMALGGWLGGSLFDASGSYMWSIIMSLVVGLVALPMALSLPKHRKPAPAVTVTA
jgi:MFS family permease